MIEEIIIEINKINMEVELEADLILIIAQKIEDNHMVIIDKTIDMGRNKDIEMIVTIIIEEIEIKVGREIEEIQREVTLVIEMIGKTIHKREEAILLIEKILVKEAVLIKKMIRIKEKEVKTEKEREAKKKIPREEAKKKTKREEVKKRIRSSRTTADLCKKEANQEKKKKKIKNNNQSNLQITIKKKPKKANLLKEAKRKNKFKTRIPNKKNSNLLEKQYNSIRIQLKFHKFIFRTSKVGIDRKNALFGVLNSHLKSA